MRFLLAAVGVGVLLNSVRAQDAAALARENALLKKKVELLRREVELLKAQLAAKGGRPAGSGKATVDDVEYEFVSLKMNGNEGVLRIAATSKRGDKRLIGQLPIRLLAADGNEHRTPAPTTNRPIRLIEGVRQEVEFRAGKVPTEVKVFTTIVLPGTGGGKGFAGARDNPVVLKGRFEVER